MITAVDTLTEEQKKEILALLTEADAEFVPPLSARGSTTQKNLCAPAAGTGVQAYFEALIRQSFILCLEEGRVAGFLSYIPDHPLEGGICDYVSTVLVGREYRRKGYTAGMYRKLFETRAGKAVATRTWSGNTAHLSLLEKLGFREIRRLADDRGAGIDTVYFRKEGTAL